MACEAEQAAVDTAASTLGDLLDQLDAIISQVEDQTGVLQEATYQLLTCLGTQPVMGAVPAEQICEDMRQQSLRLRAYYLSGRGR